MEKEFCTYTQALRMKALGFDEKCYGYFTKDEEFFYFDVDDLSSAYTKNMDNLVVNSVNGLECTAPLYQQAFRWFREKHNMQSAIKFTHSKYSFDIHFERLANGENPPVMVWHLVDSWLGLNLDLFETYEEAELACLDKLIEIVKQKQKEDGK